MQKTKKSTEFTEGPIFFRMLIFAVPIMLSGVLQLLYNMSDQVVVGQFSGDPNALAAVGSTGALTNMIVNLLMGLSVGSGVVVAQCFGAKLEKEISRTVHTSLTVALIGGIIFGLIGVLSARQLLELMRTNEDVIDSATLYMTIIFCGVPASSVYNFGATILRSVGDSRSPLIILATTGLVNVAFNLIFVIVFHLGVAGVAIATIIAQYLSAIAVVALLMRTNECYRFRFSKVCIDKEIFGKILRMGIPSGIQGTLFSLSNVMIQSSINTFPPTTISGNTAGSTIDGFTYTVMNSFYHASLTFTGQNYGAGKRKRIYRVLWYSLFQVTVIGIGVGFIEICFARELASLFVDTSQPHASAIIEAAVTRLDFMLKCYFLCGIMEVLTGHLRGLGYSVVPMLSSMFGACVFRIAWILFVFPLEAFNTPIGLYWSFPLSWILTCVLHLITCLVAGIKLKRTMPQEVQTA